MSDPSSEAEPAGEQTSPASSRKYRLPRYVKIKMVVRMADGEEMEWNSETEISVREALDFR